MLGLNKPLPAQFWDYLKEVFLHFNLGYSYYSQESVRTLIIERLPATLSLTLGAAVLWVVGGLSVGIISALRRHSLLDRGAMGGALVADLGPGILAGSGVAVPVRLGYRQIQDLPRSRQLRPAQHRPVEMVHLADHAVVRARGGLGGDLRAADAQQPERDDGRGLHPDRARQGPARAAVVRQGVRAAINPIVTLFGLEVGVLLGGAILVETVFNIPGVGRLAYKSIQSSDFPVIEGTVLLASMFIILANIVVDIAYAYLDPRVRYSIERRRAAAARRGPARRVSERGWRRARRRRDHLSGDAAGARSGSSASRARARRSRR